MAARKPEGESASGTTDGVPITDVRDPRWIQAVAHPLRIRLLAMLDSEPASPVMLARSLGVPLSATSYHIRVLRKLGLLTLVRMEARRGATEHIYRAVAHPRIAPAALAELQPAQKQSVVTLALGHVHERAYRSAAAGGFDRPGAQLAPVALELDATGWAELADAAETWLGVVDRIESDAAGRLRGAPAPAQSTPRASRRRNGSNGQNGQNGQNSKNGTVTVGLVVMLYESADAASAKL
jgi:DNA-binding transcriptional ArsR family regulator